MKVLQVPFCFYPEPVGGTEVYVAALSRALRPLGCRADIAAPGDRNADYTWDDLRVLRFEAPTALDLSELYGAGDARAALAFSRILDSERPDIVHLHAFTSAISVRLVRAAQRRNTPVLFTYHSPTASCQRGTLMRWGTEVCDGFLDLNRCTSCTLQGLGLPRPVAGVMSKVPVPVGRTLGRHGLSGGVWTAARLRELVDLRHHSFCALMDEVDHVVAVSAWVRSLLLVNGVPLAKVTLSRHGLDPRQAVAGEAARPHDLSRRPLRVAYLGRMTQVKGVHLLIQAMRSLPASQIGLHIFGIIQGPADEAYARRLHQLAADDARIQFHAPVPAGTTVSLLSQYDVLAVPSQWLETGPLVVLEAFAAGIPVMGSDLGGIAELVDHGVNGLLVAPGSVPAWRRALERLLDEPGLLGRLRAGIRPPRTMEDVAREMLELYRGVLDRRPPAAAGTSDVTVPSGQVPA